MENKHIEIVKMTGEKAAFDQSKLRRSLERSGVNDRVIKEIIEKVEFLLYEGITTKEIYKAAFSLLRKNSPPTAARYKLKKAIMELGPTGYPFEKFVGEILKHQGYDTQVGVIVKGHCVNHEVDVIAQKDDEHFMIECKYHRDQGRHCDVKIPLYIQSRFKDVEKQWKKKKGHDTKFHQGWIFTNTRFTSDAIQYGNCAGLKLVGWDYPRQGSLKERIDVSGLHPITSLTTLTREEKQKLLDANHVLCKEIYQTPEILNKTNIAQNRQKKILREARDLCREQ